MTLQADHRPWKHFQPGHSCLAWKRVSKHPGKPVQRQSSLLLRMNELPWVSVQHCSLTYRELKLHWPESLSPKTGTISWASSITFLRWRNKCDEERVMGNDFMRKGQLTIGQIPTFCLRSWRRSCLQLALKQLALWGPSAFRAHHRNREFKQKALLSGYIQSQCSALVDSFIL